MGVAFDSAEIGTVLVRVRRARRWSRETLCARTGIALDYLVALEGGEVALDPAVGEVILRAVAGAAPGLAALVYFCMATFEAELDRRRAVAMAPYLPVAGHA